MMSLSPTTPHILLVWAIIPDEHKMYLIPYSEGKKFIPYFQKAHGNLLNAEGDDDNEGLQFLNTALCEDEEGVAAEGFEEYLGVLAPYLCRSGPITGVTITQVYLSGFMQ